MRLKKSFTDCIEIRDEDTKCVIVIQRKKSDYFVCAGTEVHGPYRSSDKAVEIAGGIIATTATKQYIQNYTKGPEIPSFLRAVGR